MEILSRKEFEIAYPMSRKEYPLIQSNSSENRFFDLEFSGKKFRVIVRPGVSQDADYWLKVVTADDGKNLFILYSTKEDTGFTGETFAFGVAKTASRRK